jgi:DNA-binding transcriptional LysR family regulator
VINGLVPIAAIGSSDRRATGPGLPSKPVELRQLQAFEAVATDLHFGRAAKRLFTSQPMVSEQIRRLEQELGASLFHRTSRRVELTPAGVELLARARLILAAVGDAAAAVRCLGDGTEGTIRVGITPPVAPGLAPHLIAALAETAPGIAVDLRQMWLPDLHAALVDGHIDIGVTPGTAPPPDQIQSRLLAREPLLIGVRPSHRLAGRSYVAIDELKDDVLGQPSEALFPAWTQAQRAVLKTARIDPPTAGLPGADLSAARWVDNPTVDWILLTPSLAAIHQETTFINLAPQHHIDFYLLLPVSRQNEPALARFVHTCLSTDLPTAWTRPPPQTPPEPSR